MTISNTTARKYILNPSRLQMVRKAADCAGRAVLSPIDMREKLLTGNPVLLVLNSVDVMTSRSARGWKVPVKLALPQVSAVEPTVPSVIR